MADINWNVIDPTMPGKVGSSVLNGMVQGKENALKELAYNQALQQSQDDQATRAAYQQSGGDMNALQKLLSGQGLYRQANDIAKQQLEADAKRATIGKDNAMAQKSAQEVAMGRINWMKNGLSTLGQNPTIETATAVLQDGVRNGILTPEKAQAEIEAMQAYPGGIAGYVRNKTLELGQPKPTQVHLGNRVAMVDSNPLSQTYGKELQSYAVGMTPGERQGRVPVGYRQTQDGNLEPIPGGPADLKRQGAFNQDTAALTNSSSSFDRLAEAANSLLEHPGLAGITGIRGSIPNVPGSDAANAQALLNTLRSQVGFGVLQDMRNNSKTGGALGAISDAEGKRLEANLASLENAQSKDQMEKSLRQIIAYTQGAKDRLRGAYNLRYGNNPEFSIQQPQAQQQPSAQAGKTVVRTGTLNGRKVVQYSDGSTEYAGN